MKYFLFFNMIACVTVAGICIFTANHTYEIFSIPPGPVAILYKCAGLHFEK
jgi:hypothetical protein